MKKLDIQQMEIVSGQQSPVEAFCAGFQVGSVAVAAAIKFGLIAAPPAGAALATVALAIDVACLFV